MSDRVPGRIKSRFGKGCFDEFGAGHITDDNEFCSAGNVCRCLVCPIGAGVGNLGLDRFGALLFPRSLGTGEGSFMLTGDVRTAVHGTIGAGNLVHQPQVNPQFQMPDRGCDRSIPKTCAVDHLCQCWRFAYLIDMRVKSNGWGANDFQPSRWEEMSYQVNVKHASRHTTKMRIPQALDF